MMYEFKDSDSILFFHVHTTIDDLLYCADANEAGTSFSYFHKIGIRKGYFALKEQVWQSELIKAFV